MEGDTPKPIHITNCELLDTEIDQPTSSFIFTTTSVLNSSSFILGGGTIRHSSFNGDNLINALQFEGKVGYYDKAIIEIDSCSFENYNNAIHINSSGNLDSLRISNCNFSNNIFNIYNEHTLNIDAQNNYWGTTDESKINSAFYDFIDDTTKGKVDYSLYLLSPILLLLE